MACLHLLHGLAVVRIMMVGDVVGKPGREAANRLIPSLRSEHKADVVVINAENSAGGLGITRDIACELFEKAKVDVITLGNHAWAKRDSHEYLDAEPRVLRPANYPPGAPGQGYGVYRAGGVAFAVLSLQGRTFMDATDNPFRVADTILEELRAKTAIVLIDFHGEATSEKQAFGWYVDGRASAVIGTHTHVQTADERILPKGTAYLTDVGMTGPTDGIIGMDREAALARFLTSVPHRYEVADGPAHLCAAVIDIDAESGRATNIGRIRAT